MDLHSFSGGEMYFDEQLTGTVMELLEKASRSYGEGKAESPLIRAYAQAPESLTVLVALYRFYYYQHRYQDALAIANKSMELVARKLEFPDSWEKLNIMVLGYAVMQSMTLVRFYLLALKGAGYLNLRLGNIDEGAAMLEKIVELDSENRLGAQELLQVVEGYQHRVNANFGQQIALVASN